MSPRRERTRTVVHPMGCGTLLERFQERLLQVPGKNRPLVLVRDPRREELEGEEDGYGVLPG